MNDIKRFFLDTETTGLGDDSEVCEIALIDEHENVIINTYVKPRHRIPMDAIRIHGITNEMVEGAPTMDDLIAQVKSHVDGHHLYIYNARYDTRLLKQSVTTSDRIKPAKIHCVMLGFAPIYGQWSEYRNEYKWQTLDTACRHYEIENPSAHRALGDAISACRVWKQLHQAGIMK